MPRRTSFIRLVLFCLLVLLCSAFASYMSAPLTNTDSEEARVKNVIDQFFEVAKRQDWDAAGDLMSEDFELYTDGAATFDKKSYVRAMKEDNLETHYMKLMDLVIHVSGDGQMAWSQYRGEFRTVSHGQASHVQTAETLIFKKEAGRWKIVRAHASIKTVAEPS